MQDQTTHNTQQLNPSRRFIIAAAKGDIKSVRHALAVGIPADTAPEGKPTALCYAALVNDRSMLELLLDHGADVNYCDAMGNTACLYAARAGACACLRRLAGRGANLSVSNTLGQSLQDCCRDADTLSAANEALNSAAKAWQSN